jgi:nitroreductase
VDPKQDLRELADALTASARLAPSADNRQPWRFVSVYKDPQLTRVRSSLSPLNQWADVCSLFIVVCASPTLSVTGPSTSRRNGPISYYLYDTGLATAFLMLRATDFNLVAHPIAGFDANVVATAIGLDRSGVAALQIVALIAIGQKSEDPAALTRVPEVMRDAERTRPKREPLEQIAFHNTFGDAVSTETPEKEKPNFDRDVILVNDDGKIYHLDQATLSAMTSVDELTAEEQVPYAFIEELKTFGISTAAMPTLPSMSASIFCYLLNLASLIPPKQQTSSQVEARATDVAARPAMDVPPRRRATRKSPHLQYSGCKEAN